MKRILILGSGPIVIGQAAEFDYSGSQAARALRAEGYTVHLLNSNPATIMTDPITADSVHLLPLEVESVRQILEQYPVDAVLPTMGGQTALNLALACAKAGLWERYGIQVIGASLQAIEVAEDREKFRRWGEALGLPMLPAGLARSYLEAKDSPRSSVTLWCCGLLLRWGERGLSWSTLKANWNGLSVAHFPLAPSMKFS